MKLMPGPKNHLFVVDGDEDSIRKWVEIDVYRDLRLPQGEAPYSTPADRRVAIDENFYLILVEKLGYPGRVELRRYADSSLVRELSLPLGIGSEISLLGGEEGISLIKGAGGTYFHQLTDDGSDAYRFGATTGEVLALHPGYLAVTQSNSNPTELWDTARPVKLATIGQSYLLGEGRVAANPVAPVAAIADYMGVIHQFALAPKVPVILKRTFKGSEAAADVSFNVGFSEATEHPVSVSVSWCSSPADIRIDQSPAILRPGQRNITLPFKLNDDRVAEGEETVRVAISVSGNGQTEEFDVDVTIQDNDIIEFDTKVRDSEIILSSALDMAAGSPVFGFAPRAVVDPVTEKMFQLDEAEDNEIFAHTLVGNEQYVIVGSPGTWGTAHNSFYIVDRKE